MLSRRSNYALLFASLLILSLCLVINHVYLDADWQKYVGWIALAALYAFSKISWFQIQPARSIFFLFALFMGFRYIDWRITNTLNYIEFWDYLGSAILFLAELYGFALLFLNVYIGFSPTRVDPIPIQGAEDEYPTVDIFIPTYNESEEIIRMTVIGALNTNYPNGKKKIYILDDGGTNAKRNDPEKGDIAWERHYALRRLAKALGVHYLTRESNHLAKAGNVNHALLHSEGELILFLDCDQIPTKDFLINTVGQFQRDPKLFLVQTPHFFVNQNPVNTNLSDVNEAPDESELFYRNIMPAMNFWNAVFFCGSAALLRRECLVRNGGLSTKTITEDAETSLELHSMGYSSCYIEKPMVCGLSPESNDDYLTQHSRWGKGMSQILMIYKPLSKKGLSIPQRIAYFATSFSWLFGFSRAVFFLAPAAYILLNLNVYDASWFEIVIFTIPYALSIFLIIKYFFGFTRQVFFSEIYETVKSFRLMRELLPVLFNPWRQTFLVTPKGITNDKVYLSKESFPLIILIGINVISLLVVGARWVSSPENHGNLLMTSIWCLFNSWLGILALGTLWERVQLRHFHRLVDAGQVEIETSDHSQRYQGEIHNISAGGIGFSLAQDVSASSEAYLFAQDGYGKKFRFHVKIVSCIQAEARYIYGCQFIYNGPVPADVIEFVYGDSARWQRVWDRRSKFQSPISLFFRLTKLGIKALANYAIETFQAAFLGLWNFLKSALTTDYVFKKISAIFSWFLYCFYLILIYLSDIADSRKTRRFPRVRREGIVYIDFPRLDSTIRANLIDVSLSGVGIEASLPFSINESGEHIILHIEGPDGGSHALDCFIRRRISRGHISQYGAEFIVDQYSYATIVDAVYGRSAKMVASLTIGNIKEILSILFINPDRRPQARIQE